jgi:glycosyltransferase involved in cell wall biosynthesis
MWQIAQNLLRKSLDRRRSFLVLHDINGWALDHVFEMWFAECSDFRVVRRNWSCFSTARAFIGYDAVIFGYLDIYLRFCFDPKRSIVVIHDPCEIFPQIPDWKNAEPDPHKIDILKRLRAVIVISQEMEDILRSHGVSVHRIPTMSRLPVLESKISRDQPVRAISIYKEYPRKNSPCLKRLAENGRKSSAWDLLLHQNPDYSDQEYIKMIDLHPIYVCASWQEGGPLPAMDVMSRGGVVVTTPVGQIQEIITHDESGFLCENEEDFEQVLRRLFNDSEYLLQVRIKSLAAYRKFRDKYEIQKSVSSTLLDIQI